MGTQSETEEPGRERGPRLTVDSVVDTTEGVVTVTEGTETVTVGSVGAPVLPVVPTTSP